MNSTTTIGCRRPPEGTNASVKTRFVIRCNFCQSNQHSRSRPAHLTRSLTVPYNRRCKRMKMLYIFIEGGQDPWQPFEKLEKVYCFGSNMHLNLRPETSHSTRMTCRLSQRPGKVTSLLTNSHLGSVNFGLKYAPAIFPLTHSECLILQKILHRTQV